jgi:hypothetical protein
MTKILLLLALILPVFAMAQNTQPDSTKNDIHEAYCMVIATSKMFSNKVSIQVDFGQATSWWKGNHGDVIKDNAGKVVNFNSVIDALNYMATQGWTFVNAYALSEGSTGKVLNYILRRKLE